MNSLNQWMIGLVVAVVGGYIVTEISLWLIRLRIGRKPKRGKRVWPWLTGCIERLAFATFIGLGISGIAPGMMGWLALKFATHWNRNAKPSDNDTNQAFAALLAGLISMLFAAIGGGIIRRCPPLP
jgi:hypothetical protein